MPGKSLGLIETVGLAAAVEAADAALKSAYVRLIGYELTQGSGMVTVKFEGEVGAINAAIAAGVAAASKVGTVFAHKVIARTAHGIERMIYGAESIDMLSVESRVLPAVNLETITVINVEEPQTLSCREEPVETTPKPQPQIVENSKKNLRIGGRKK